MGGGFGSAQAATFKAVLPTGQMVDVEVRWLPLGTRAHRRGVELPKNIEYVTVTVTEPRAGTTAADS